MIVRLTFSCIVSVVAMLALSYGPYYLVQLKLLSTNTRSLGLVAAQSAQQWCWDVNKNTAVGYVAIEATAIPPAIMRYKGGDCKPNSNTTIFLRSFSTPSTARVVIREQIGWPVPYFEGDVFVSPSGAVHYSSYIAVGLFQVPIRMQWGAPVAIVLCTAVIFVLLSVRMQLWRAIHIRRGRCPMCGYPLFRKNGTTQCTECGWCCSKRQS